MEKYPEIAQAQKHLKGISFHLNELSKTIDGMVTGNTISVVSPIKLPAPTTIRLPYDKQEELIKAYGQPGKQILSYVNFPCKDMRLYSRDGTILTDKDRDPKNLPDHKCHINVAQSFQLAIDEVYALLGEEEFKKQGWNVFAGFTRDVSNGQKKGGNSLSTHCWSVAVDFNPNENPFSKTGTSTKRTFSDKAIDVMERYGWLSGGRAWKNDWMHFQCAIPYIEPNSYYGINGLPEHIEPMF